MKGKLLQVEILEEPSMVAFSVPAMKIVSFCGLPDIYRDPAYEFGGHIETPRSNQAVCNHPGYLFLEIVHKTRCPELSRSRLQMPG
jgi:hypothetical protein